MFNKSPTIPKNPKDPMKSSRQIQRSHKNFNKSRHEPTMNPKGSLKTFQTTPTIPKDPKGSQRISWNLQSKSKNPQRSFTQVQESQGIPRNPKESQRIPKDPNRSQRMTWEFHWLIPLVNWISYRLVWIWQTATNWFTTSPFFFVLVNFLVNFFGQFFGQSTFDLPQLFDP